MTDRWTAETEELVHRTLHDLDVRINDLTGDHHCNLVSQVVLTALAGAGLLVPPGGETREEWGHRYRAFRRDWTRVASSSRESAMRDAVDFREAFGKAGGEAEVLHRTVHTGPWVAVSET